MLRFLKTGVCALTALWISTASAQQDFSNVEIKATKVAEHIHMLTGRGGNLGVSIGEDGVLLVDDQYAPLADRILAAISKLGGEKPRFILNTHWHGDHTGGNEFFGESGTIIAHTNVYERLATPQVLFGRKIDALPPAALPVITFDESLSVHFNGEELRVIHFSHGHTDGDCVVFFIKSNVVHMGDLMFMGMFPFVDLDHGGDVLGLIRSVESVIDQVKPGIKVIPGHGPLSDYAGLASYHQMLVDTTQVVRSAIQAGMSAEEIKKLPAPTKWKSWGNGFIKTDRWMETIYKSLTRK
jgi:cyclase